MAKNHHRNKRPLHHRILSHPIGLTIGGLIACAGIALIGIAISVSAMTTSFNSAPACTKTENGNSGACIVEKPGHLQSVTIGSFSTIFPSVPVSKAPEHVAVVTLTIGGDVTVAVPDGQDPSVTTVPTGTAMEVGYWDGNASLLTEVSTGRRWITTGAPTAAIANAFVVGGLLALLGLFIVSWSLLLRTRGKYRPVMLKVPSKRSC